MTQSNEFPPAPISKLQQELMDLLRVDANFLQSPEALRAMISEAAKLAVHEAHDGGWPEPSPLLSNRDLPTFPIGALPPDLGWMVEAVAANTQTPIDLPAVLGLAALAAACVGRVEFRIRDGWTEPVTVYALGLIGSGNRKSSLVRPLTQPLWDVQSDLRSATAATRDNAVRVKERLKAQLEGAKSKLKRSPGDAQADLDVERLQIELSQVVEPPVPVLVVNDATPEALAKTMAEQGERLAMFDAEGGGLTTMVGARYTAQTNLDLMLKAHAGDSVSSIRVGREAVSMDHPMLAVGVLSQPETLRELRGVDGAAERGLFARLLVAAPADMLGRRVAETPPIPVPVAAAYRKLLTDLAMALWDEPRPRTLRPDTDAYRALLAFHDHVESRLGPDGDLRPLEGYAGKLVGATARYAALHHLAHYGIAGLDWPVTAASVGWAIHIASWATEHYRFAVAGLGFNGATADAERVLAWLKRHGSVRVSTREVQKALGLPSAEQTVAAMELLAERGWVRMRQAARRSGAGRQPSPTWDVIPEVSTR